MTKKLYSSVLCLVLILSMMAGCQPKSPETTQTPTTVPAETQALSTEPPEITEPEQILHNPPEVTAPEDDPYEPPPTEPPVQVVMPDYELTYSGEMADQISYRELTDQAGLRFDIRLSTGEVKLFELLIGQVQGNFVQMKENSAGEQIPVSFLMEPIPEGLSDGDYEAFTLGQELANEIVASLILK